jgi:hypothetical protein
MNSFVVSTSGNIESFHPFLGSLVRSSSPPSNNVIPKLSNPPRTCSSGCHQCGIEAIGMSSVQQCAPLGGACLDDSRIVLDTDVSCAPFRLAHQVNWLMGTRLSRLVIVALGPPCPSYCIMSSIMLLAILLFLRACRMPTARHASRSLSPLTLRGTSCYHAFETLSLPFNFSFSTNFQT